MKIGELAEIMKVIKATKSIAVEDNVMRFKYEGNSVIGFVDKDVQLDNCIIEDIDVVYSFINDKDIADNELSIDNDRYILSDDKKSIEVKLTHKDFFKTFDIIKPKTMLSGLDLSKKMKVDEIHFKDDGTYLVKNGHTLKKKINDNTHDIEAKISLKDKMNLLPNKVLEYFLSLSGKLICKYTENDIDYYFIMHVDTYTDKKTKKKAEDILGEL